MKRSFASDNNSGVHPSVLAYMAKVNTDHAVGYGGDEFTQIAINQFKKVFGNQTEPYFVFNGTGANILALSAFTQSFHSVICASTAHIMVDECGAPEKFTGCKLLPLDTPNGKLTPELVAKYLHGFDFEHHSQPRIVSISQVTELGTVYQPHEIKALADLVHQFGMYLHMDGARLANAAVSLDLPFKAFTTDCGVDVLSFGGTKNGLMMGEAVVFLNPEFTSTVKYQRKQAAQLYSKMRFMAAQFLAYFENDLWKSNAQHANKMAQILKQRVEKLGVIVTQSVDANGVFAIIPDSIRDALLEKYFFYSWDEARHEVRWMTSFDTTEDDVEHFCNELSRLLLKNNEM
jgi:threonine aldolase